MIANIIKWLCRISGTWKTCHKHYCYKHGRYEPEHQNCRCELGEYQPIIDRQMEIARIVIDECTIVPNEVVEDIMDADNENS